MWNLGVYRKTAVGVWSRVFDEGFKDRGDGPGFAERNAVGFWKKKLLSQQPIKAFEHFLQCDITIFSRYYILHNSNNLHGKFLKRSHFCIFLKDKFWTVLKGIRVGFFFTFKIFLLFLEGSVGRNLLHTQ